MKSSTKAYVLEGDRVEGECIELRVQTREEDILRKLGVHHLDGRVTRPRHGDDETDATILKEAGVSHVGNGEDEARYSKNEACERAFAEPWTPKQVEILRKAGVAWIDGAAVEYDDRELMSQRTADSGAAGGGASDEKFIAKCNDSTYAIKNLLTHLERGWAADEVECEKCGMPTSRISQDGDAEECVYCGVAAEQDDCGVDVEGRDDLDAIAEKLFKCAVERSAVASERDRYYDSIVTNNCEGLQMAPSEHNIYAHYPEENESFDDESWLEKRLARKIPKKDTEMYKEELGWRLFNGWELTDTDCPECKMPLITENGGKSTVCLRCLM